MTSERTNLVALMVLAIVVALPCGSLLVYEFGWMRSWRDTTVRQQLTAVEQWPEPIQELRADMQAAGIDTESFAVYLLYGEPRRTLTEVVCRMDCDERAWALLRDRFDLRSVPHAEGIWLHEKIVRVSSPEWWPSPEDEAVAYFASAHLLAGGEGPLYYAAYDPTAGRAFVHYHFNF